jgi:hypothetical protein
VKSILCYLVISHRNSRSSTISNFSRERKRWEI